MFLVFVSNIFKIYLKYIFIYFYHTCLRLPVECEQYHNVAAEKGDEEKKRAEVRQVSMGLRQQVLKRCWSRIEDKAR